MIARLQREGSRRPEFRIRLAALRKEKGLTQKQLADVFGTTERNIRFYEGGDRRPGFDGPLAIADYFDVSMDYLMGRTDKREIHR